jgi:hypothetical protein
MRMLPTRSRLGLHRSLAGPGVLGVCILLALPVLLVVPACTGARRQQIAVFERLGLDARLARDHGTVGEMIPVHYSLVNLGKRRVRACVSYEAGFNEIGTKARLGSVLDSANRACRKPPFELGPGEIFQWDGEIQVLDVGPGRATLWTFVRVVDLASCDAHGCDARSLIPGPLSLRVVERRASL